MHWRTLLWLCAIAVLPSSLVAQGRETGFLNRTVTVAGQDHLYQVYVPRSYTPDVTWPVILSLHGGGAYGSDGLRQTYGGIAAAIRQYPERFPAVVVFPQGPADGSPGWHGTGSRVAIAALDAALEEFNGDPTRVSLTGGSAGGNGALYLALHHRERFASVVAIAGWVAARRGGTSGVDYPSLAPSSAADEFAFVVSGLSGLPTWVLHGDADTTVPIDDSRKLGQLLTAADSGHRYTEMPGLGHNDGIETAYERADVVDWLLSHRRNSGRTD